MFMFNSFVTMNSSNFEQRSLITAKYKFNGKKKYCLTPVSLIKVKCYGKKRPYLFCSIMGRSGKHRFAVSSIESNTGVITSKCS